jgi:hypothetical protein
MLGFTPLILWDLVYSFSWLVQYILESALLLLLLLLFFFFFVTLWLKTFKNSCSYVSSLS